MLTICSLPKKLNQKGQSIVEISLITPLVLIALMIPIDFAIMFQTGTRIQNAVREAARIGAAIEYDDAVAENALSTRLAGYNVTSSGVTLRTTGATGCVQTVFATATIAYPFLFYRMMNWFGFNVPSTHSILRSAQMRYEFQPVTNAGAQCT